MAVWKSQYSVCERVITEGCQREAAWESEEAKAGQTTSVLTGLCHTNPNTAHHTPIHANNTTHTTLCQILLEKPSHRLPEGLGAAMTHSLKNLNHHHYHHCVPGSVHQPDAALPGLTVEATPSSPLYIHWKCSLLAGLFLRRWGFSSILCCWPTVLPRLQRWLWGVHYCLLATTISLCPVSKIMHDSLHTPNSCHYQ